MEEKHRQILDKIIEVEGKCLTGKLCDECPFSKKCLPRFFTSSHPSHQERYMWAVDAIARSEIMLDDVL